MRPGRAGGVVEGGAWAWLGLSGGGGRGRGLSGAAPTAGAQALGEQRRRAGLQMRLTHLRMDRETFCFQGLSLRMPMPKPERKNSSPVVTRSHFCEASNSSTAESQMKACSLLQAGAGVTGAPHSQATLGPHVCTPSSC